MSVSNGNTTRRNTTNGTALNINSHTERLPQNLMPEDEAIIEVGFGSTPGRAIFNSERAEFRRMRRQRALPGALSYMPVDTSAISESSVLDLFLLRQFTLGADLILPDPSGPNPVCDPRDPTWLAFKQQYLLHSILGLSAMEDWVISSRTDERKLDVAFGHHNNAILLARPYLVRISYDYAESLFWFTVYQAIFNLAEVISRPPSTERVDYVEEIVTIFRYCRTTTLCIKELDNDYYLREMIQLRYHLPGGPDLRDVIYGDIPEARHIKILAQSTLTGRETEETIEAMEDLFIILVLLKAKPRDKQTSMLLLIWVEQLQETFFDICRRRMPVAMILLCWFAHLINIRQDMWFFNGWPKALYRSCMLHLRSSRLDLGLFIGVPGRAVFPPDGIDHEAVVESEDERQAREEAEAAETARLERERANFELQRRIYEGDHRNTGPARARMSPPGPATT